MWLYKDLELVSPDPECLSNSLFEDLGEIVSSVRDVILESILVTNSILW